MKTIKKLASIALALVMVLCLTAPALAANVTIKLPAPDENTDPNASETYEAYKIFDADVAGEEVNEGTSTFDHVAYSISENSPFFDVVSSFVGINLTEIANENGVKTYDVSVGDDFSAPDFAIALQAVVNAENFAGEIVATGEATLNTDATLNLGDGYFLIVGSLGSKAILDTVGHEDVTITTKNDLPTIEKDTPVIEGLKIGDSVPYTITVNAKPGAAKYVVHDTMGKGLTYNGDVVVSVGGAVLDASNYTVETDPEDGCAFHLSFTQAYLDTITEATDIVLNYSATINNEATISVDTTTNKAKLDYGENGHTEDSEETQTQTPLYSFDLVKTTSDELGKQILEDAEFELYDVAEGGEAIELVFVDAHKETVKNEETGEETEVDVPAYYRPATDDDENTTTTIVAGVVTIQGLGTGTYYLEETKAPAGGYNKLNTRQAVTVGADIDLTADVTPETTTGEGDDAVTTPATWNEGGVRVINLAGHELPSTGGIGTTIFYIAGGVLAVGAGILLVTKKRVGAKEE